MRGSFGHDLILGFIAAAGVTATVHQLMYKLVTSLGLARIDAWSMKRVPPFGVPSVVNGMLWAGLWGMLFAAVEPKLPGGAIWLKGLVFGWLIVVFSNWLLLPTIKGRLFGVPNQAIFAGGDQKRLLANAMVLGVFGTSLAVVYGMLRTLA